MTPKRDEQLEKTTTFFGGVSIGLLAGILALMILSIPVATFSMVPTPQVPPPGEPEIPPVPVPEPECDGDDDDDRDDVIAFLVSLLPFSNDDDDECDD